jgi:hypothetical protein
LRSVSDAMRQKVARPVQQVYSRFTSPEGEQEVRSTGSLDS